MSGIFGAVPGGLTLLRSVAASAVAAVDFTADITAAFSMYEVRYAQVVPASNDVDFRLRVSADAGGSWKTSSYIGALAYGTGGPSAFGLASGTGAVDLNGGGGGTYGVGNTAALGGISGTLKIAPSGTAGKKIAYGRSAYYRSGAPGYMDVVSFNGFWNGGNDAINALRFLFSSGNIASGTFALYGVKS